MVLITWVGAVTVELEAERWLEQRRFRALRESGATISEIARETGLNWRTVRKYLRPSTPGSPPPADPTTGHTHPFCFNYCDTPGMIIRLADEQDAPGLIALAGQVEHWFGPMVENPGFHATIDKHIRRATALVATAGPDLLGGLLLGTKPPTYHVHWLVVSERARRQGIGRALIADAMRRFVQRPATIEVVTFGADHPGATESGARIFYERLGFTPAQTADPGPEGGSRQVYRKTFP